MNANDHVWMHVRRPICMGLNWIDLHGVYQALSKNFKRRNNNNLKFTIIFTKYIPTADMTCCK